MAVVKFKGCLDGLKYDFVNDSINRVELNPEDYDALAEHFRSERDPGRVNYMQFAAEVNRIFTLTDLEKDPTKRVETYNVTSVLDPEDVLNPEEEKKVDTCLKRLGDIVLKRKLHIKPMFQAKVRF